MGATPPAPRLTVAVSTRNRHDMLVACVRSLRKLGDDAAVEVLVVDDASDEPAEPVLRAALDPDYPYPLRVIRHAKNTGYIPARNEMAREARAPFVLSLDDDAALLDDGILRALEVIEADPTVAAIAITQVDSDGRDRPFGSLPAGLDHPCQVPSFLGYGHILRRDLFLSLGGYREIFWYYGEEKEFCKRLLDRGGKVVYLPDVRVFHLITPVGRNKINRFRYGFRNDCFDALMNEPLPKPLASIPARFYRYARYQKVLRRDLGADYRGSLVWAAGQILGNLPALWRQRHPLRWSTYSAWKRLNRDRPRYAPAPAETVPAHQG